jgi:hypothetical protein
VVSECIVKIYMSDAGKQIGYVDWGEVKVLPARRPRQQ